MKYPTRAFLHFEYIMLFSPCSENTNHHELPVSSKQAIRHSTPPITVTKPQPFPQQRLPFGATSAESAVPTQTTGGCTTSDARCLPFHPCRVVKPNIYNHSTPDAFPGIEDSKENHQLNPITKLPNHFFSNNIVKKIIDTKIYPVQQGVLW